jgi:hypothetical protein
MITGVQTKPGQVPCTVTIRLRPLGPVPVSFDVLKLIPVLSNQLPNS